MAKRPGAPKGNDNARRGTMFRDAIRKALAEKPDSLLRIARKLIAKADQGDMQAIRELADRLDGKPTQVVDIGEDDAPLAFTFKIHPAGPGPDWARPEDKPGGIG